MTTSTEAVVIGAGAAGLGVAVELERRGAKTTVLERRAAVGGQWAGRYEGLVLNTCRQLSGIRGDPIPRKLGNWISGRQLLAYLRGLPARHRLDVRLGVAAERIERRERGWLVRTDRGEWLAGAVVIATGHDRVPTLPAWPGASGFPGRLLHSSAYRRAADFRGRDVLVVGPGNSGTEIATQLARGGARRVWLAVRTPVNFVAAEVAGVAATFFARAGGGLPAWMLDRGGLGMQRLAYGDFPEHGMGRAPVGIGTELRTRGLGPVLERGFAAELRAGRIEIVAALERFDRASAVLADGTALQPDAVIAATGYSHGLEPLVGDLGVLRPCGRPEIVDGRHHHGAPGLFFHGFWLPLSGQLPAMRRSAPRIAARIRARRPAEPRAGRVPLS